MRRVMIESPFAGDVYRNLRYLRAAMRDSLDRGESPFASHALYTQPGVLDDGDPVERARGIEAGIRWGELADLIVVYADLGVSDGVEFACDVYRAMGKPIEYRSLPGWSDEV